MSQLADLVHVDAALISYVRRLAEASREAPDVRIGLSTRGALAWVRSARRGRSPRAAGTSSLRTSPLLPVPSWGTAC